MSFIPIPPVKAHRLRRNRRFTVGEVSGYNIHPAVSTWAAQVVTNGGPLPSLNTRWALSIFYNTLSGASLISSIKCLNCMVPDSPIAMRTPLIQGAGFALWTLSARVLNSDMQNNSGFMTAPSNQASPNCKFMNTGFPGTSFTSVNNGGLSAYGTLVPGTYDNGSNNHDIGYTNNAGTNGTLLDFYLSGGTPKPFGGFGDLGNSALTGASQQTHGGFVSYSRTAANAAALYWASSLVAFSQIASTTNAPTGTLPAATMYVGAMNATDQGNTGILSTGMTFSFVAFHDGLSSANTQILFNAVQAMRMDLGGGFI